jgi:two-component system response regulator
MTSDAAPLTILLAEDSENDRFMLKKAVEKSHVSARVFMVEDGQEAMDFLRRSGKYAEGDHPKPDLLLLDLNMPRKSGIETLREIRGDANLSSLPVVVLTTSEAEQDIIRSYDLGVNWFLTKPATLESLGEMVKFLANHWQAIADHSNKTGL